MACITCLSTDPSGCTGLTNGSFYRQRHSVGYTSISATIYVPAMPSPTPPSGDAYYAYLGGHLTGSSQNEVDAGIKYYGASEWAWEVNIQQSQPPSSGTTSPKTDPNGQKYFTLTFEVVANGSNAYARLKVNGSQVGSDYYLEYWATDGSNVQLKSTTSIAGFTGGSWSVSWTNVQIGGSNWTSEPAECNCCQGSGTSNVTMSQDYYDYVVSLTS